MKLLTVMANTAENADIEAGVLIEAMKLKVHSITHEQVETYKVHRHAGSTFEPAVDGFLFPVASPGPAPVFLCHIYFK